MPLIRKEPATAAPAPRPPAAEQLTHGGPDERWSAARRLGGDPREVAALGSALLTEQDPKVREAILTSLARSGTAEAVKAVLLHLRSDDASLRTGALDALRAMPAAVAPQLESLLRDPDPDVRVLACDLVRDVPPAEASALLAAVLATESEVNVCAAAVEILAEVGGPDDAQWLIACADRFPDAAFLRFSIELTLERIAAGAPAARG